MFRSARFLFFHSLQGAILPEWTAFEPECLLQGGKNLPNRKVREWQLHIVFHGGTSLPSANRSSFVPRQ